jgi:hypothetical protein
MLIKSVFLPGTRSWRPRRCTSSDKQEQALAPTSLRPLHLLPCRACNQHGAAIVQGRGAFIPARGDSGQGRRSSEEGEGLGCLDPSSWRCSVGTMRERVGLRRNFASCGKRGFMENGEVWVVQEGEVQRGCGGERRECRLCSMGEV